MELEFYIPKLGLIPRCIRPVRPVADTAIVLLPRFHDYRNLITITTMGECNGNTRLVGSQGSTETYPSTTRTCITHLGYRRYFFSDISFGMCLCLMSWVQQVHSAAVVARSLGCQCDTEMPTGRTLTET